MGNLFTALLLNHIIAYRTIYMLILSSVSLVWIVLVYKLNVRKGKKSLFAIYRSFPLSIQVHGCH